MRCSASRGSGSSAACSPRSCRTTRSTSSAATDIGRDPGAGAVLDRHRRRLAAVRAAVRAQGRDRPGAVRLDRPDAVRHRPAISRGRAPATTHGLGALAFLAAPGSWRIALDLSCSACSPASTSCRCSRWCRAARRASTAVARHRRQQHPQRAVPGRARPRFGIGLGALGPVDPADLPRAPRCSTSLVALYIYTLVPEFLMRFRRWILGAGGI